VALLHAHWILGGRGALGPYDDDKNDDDDDAAATDEYRLQHHGLYSDEYHDLPAHGWDPWEPQEIGLSQLTGAPVGTQTNSQVTVSSLCANTALFARQVRSA